MKSFSQVVVGLLSLLATVLFSGIALAAPEAAPAGGGEASLVVPHDMIGTVTFMNGTPGRTLLMIGLGVSLAGMIFGLAIFMQLKNAPVHKSMLEISELIYETCKTYLVTQMKFILILEAFIGAIIVVYFGVLGDSSAAEVLIILLFSIIGIAGSSASSSSS